MGMSKFKVGDRVRKVNEDYLSAFEIGEELEVFNISPIGNACVRKIGSTALCEHDTAYDSDLELITPHPEPSGGLNNYWLVTVENPQRGGAPYQAEADDIIFALNLTFDEGEAFKAIWRSATARLGYGKPDNTPLYNAQKLVHRAKRILQRAEMNEGEDK